MMILKKQNIYTIFEQVVALGLVFSVIVAMVPTQAVDASTKEVVVNVLSSFEEYPLTQGVSFLLQNETEQAPKETFPVAEERKPRRTMWVLATFYSLDPAQTDATPCIPANGEDLCALREKTGFHNTIAANFLRFGTAVRLPELTGDKMLVVRDRMNARYNGQARIDVLVDTKEEAKKLGVKWGGMEIF